MITTEMVYWIVMLDKICVAFYLAASILGVILVAYTLAAIADREEFPWYYPVWVVFELFFLCGAVFLPNTKQMATIYLLPKVVNNEKIQSIGERTLDTGDKLLQLMQQYIAEKMTNSKPYPLGTKGVSMSKFGIFDVFIDTAEDLIDTIGTEIIGTDKDWDK